VSEARVSEAGASEIRASERRAMRVIVAEDQALLREGLALVLAQCGCAVVAAVGDPVSLVRDSCELEPDLVITDIRMPPAHTDEGLRAALEIRAARPRIAILVLTQYLRRAVAAELLARPTAGTGYLLKQRVADITAFHRDLRRVAAGETVLDPEVVQLMVAARARSDRDPVARLSARQREVLALMAEGASNAAIARKLSVSERAVVAHCSNIYGQLGFQPSDDEHRRVLAVLRYLASQS
jgi:DNA-binding NarL/FixJ family response regulator